MSCQIIRNPKTNKISKVTAPNGKESILYKSILESIPDKIDLDQYTKDLIIDKKINGTSKDEIALALWSKVYTSKFKDWFGDWENTLQAKINVWQVEPSVQSEFGEPTDITDLFKIVQNSDGEFEKVKVTEELIEPEKDFTDFMDESLPMDLATLQYEEYLRNNPPKLNKVDKVVRKNIPLNEVKKILGITEDVSKVVDENGEPDLVYHGSNKMFSEFGGQFNFFSKLKSESQQFGDNIYPVFLNIKNIKTTQLEELSPKDFDNIDGAQVESGTFDGVNNFVVKSDKSSQIKSLYNEGDFSLQTGNIYYDMTNEEVNNIDPTLESRMLEIVEALGGSVKRVNEIKDFEGNPINAYGKMNGLSGIISLLEGKANVGTLVEESVHMIQAIMGPDHPLMKVMMNDITGFDVYNQVKEQYKNVYETEDEFRFEAVGKLIKKHIVDGEALGNFDRDVAKRWWERVLTVLRRLVYGKKLDDIQPKLDAFQKTAELIRSKEILEELTPVNFNPEGVIQLAKDFKMNESGFMDKKSTPLDELKIKANKLDIQIATSVNGNYYFSRNGKMINPFRGEFYELAPRETKPQEEVIRDLKRTSDRLAPKKVIVVDKNGIKREMYQFKDDGTIVQNRVSGLQDDKFNKNKTIKEIQEADANPTNIIFREGGTEMHDIGEQFMQIGANMRDKINLVPGITVPQTEPSGNKFISKAKVNKIGRSVNKLLDDIEAIQNNIDKNGKATILTEQFVYDESKDIGGSMDVLVMFSDGSAAIYDYKFINTLSKLSNESEIPFSKRNSYHLQISEYKRILEDVYGVTTFRETRILPFSVTYKFVKGKGVQKELTALEGFNTESKKNYLVPLPVANEITSNEKLNQILSALFEKEKLLGNKISKNWMNPEIKNPLIDESDLIRKSIKAIQINSDVTPLIQSMNATLDNLAKISKSATLDHLEDLVNIDAEVKLFKSIYVNAMDFIPKDKEVEFNVVLTRLGKAETAILDKLKELLVTLHPEINEPQREMDILGSNFNTMADVNHPVFEVARKLIVTSFGDTKRSMDELIDELEEKKNALESWAKSKGMSLQDAYKEIINEKTGNLKGMYSQQFHETSKAKRKEGDVKWFKDNYKITEEGKKLYAENLKVYAKSLEGTTKSFAEMKMKEWKDNNDLTNDNAWLNFFTISNYTEMKNPEKNYSDNYKNLLNPSNKPLKEFYDFYIEKNRFFNSLVDDRIDANFIANVSKDLIDSLAHGDSIKQTFKNTKNNFINSLKVRQNDTVTVEGEDRNEIPLLYKDSFAYKDKDGKWVNGSETKSFDLSSNLVLFGESVFNKHNMNGIKGTVEGLKLLINNQKVIQTNNFGKVKVDDITGKVVVSKSEKNTNAEVFDAQTTALVYGKRIQNKDRYFTVFGETLSRNKAVSSVMSYMSTKSLALNYVSGLGNFFGAYSNAYIKGVGGRYYTNKQMLKIHKLQASRGNKDFYNHMTSFWNVGNPHWNKDEAARLSMSKLTKNLTYEKWYILQEKGDEFVANTILGSMLQNYGLDENGVPTRLALLPEGSKSLYDRTTRKDDKFVVEGLSNEAFDDFRKMVLYVSKQVKGTANPQDISMIQTTLWGKSLMHFKSWIAPMVKERYGDMKYTPEVREWEYGRYRSFFTELFSKKFLPNLAKLSLDIITFGKMKYKGDTALLKEQFRKWQKDNPDIAHKIKIEDYLELRERTIKETIHELKILASMFILIMAAKGDWDDDGVADYKQTFLTKQMFKILNRSYLELSFFTSPTSFKDLVKTPIPMVQVGVDVFNVMGNTGDEIGDAIFGEDKVDNTDIGHYSKRLFPTLPSVFSIMEDLNLDDDE